MLNIDDEEPAPQEAPTDVTVPMDKLAKVYRRMQSRVQELTAQYESEIEDIKRQQDVVKIALKDQMLKLGVSSVRTDQGTVVLSTKTRYNTQDWDSLKSSSRNTMRWTCWRSVLRRPTWLRSCLRTPV
jgi:hypothetical protein